MIYAYPTELAHHGIKGQKWGIRRFVNEDGTLTAAGQKRYSSSSKRVTKNGETVEIVVSKAKKYNDGVEETAHTMYANGKKVTIAYLDKYGDTTNLNWISTATKASGKGYAQSMMDHIIKYSKDSNGSKFMTLEVPDEDYNARHIYEKYGFEKDKKRISEFGLTNMKRTL